MATPRVCVLIAPGTNCEVETAFAFEVSGAEVECVHLFRVLENPAALHSYQVLCIPGGFSYGDDIGAGVIFASQLRVNLRDAIGEFLSGDKLVLGICNGFQVLLKSAILPGGAASWPPLHDYKSPATLTWNDNGKYTARWIRLRVNSKNNIFLRGIEEIDLPVAHAEGKFVVRDESLLDLWNRSGQLAACYREWQVRGGRYDEHRSKDAAMAAESRAQAMPFPDNPNGSVSNIAGLGDPTGRVLGLMPHPERFTHATQHPNWTRLRLTGEGDGLRFFRNAVEYFR